VQNQSVHCQIWNFVDWEIWQSINCGICQFVRCRIWKSVDWGIYQSIDCRPLIMDWQILHSTVDRFFNLLIVHWQIPYSTDWQIPQSPDWQILQSMDCALADSTLYRLTNSSVSRWTHSSIYEFCAWQILYFTDWIPKIARVNSISMILLMMFWAKTANIYY
jgi:hypothetical protein